MSTIARSIRKTLVRWLSRRRALPAADPCPAIAGSHIDVLIAIAQRPGGDADDIIAEWNGWVSHQREKNPNFVLEMRGFDASADIWKSTPLWARPMGTGRHRLILRRINLSGARLEDANLDDAYLYYAVFAGSRLFLASLRRTTAANADFRDAILEHANLEHADLQGASFDAAHASFARFDNATANFASFESASLTCASIVGTHLRVSDFRNAKVTAIKYRRYTGWWPLRRDAMLNRYLGIRGIDSCYGDPGFRRDALDQDFIDEKYQDTRLFNEINFRASLAEFPKRFVPRILFTLWSLTDYGRSAFSVFLTAVVLISIFGTAYQYLLIPSGNVTLEEGAQFEFGAYFAAAMGFATLGLGDLLRAKSPLGAFVVFLNVFTGFVFFGMMIAVIQNKFARRS